MNDKKEKFGTQTIKFDYSTNLFYLLYENDFIVKPAAKDDRLEYNWKPLVLISSINNYRVVKL